MQVELMQVLGWCASAVMIDGDLDSGQAYLDEAVVLADELGSGQVLVAEAYHMGYLQEFIQPSERKYAHLHEQLLLLKQAQYQPPKSVQLPVQSENTNQSTYTLRVQTLGQEYIERDGIRLTTSDWRAAPREMFLYILFQESVTKEEINLTFWPDSDSKKVRNLFHTTLYRVRQALGDNVIFFEDNLYQINPQVDIWCDAHEIETAATQARLLSARDPRTEDLWNKAVDLYQGAFLQSIDAEWADERRESLHETYIEALMGLGQCARAHDDFRAALDAYKRALDEEPYREDINRAIMICYADLGEKHQIISHLDKLKQLLRTELEVDPSPETIELANRLLA
jgi:DNA-binding SARP family transcriptional activator